VPVTATALGAVVIEKHLTLNREDGGVDSHFSMEPEEFAQLVRMVKQSYESLGQVQIEPSEAELACRNYRRSVYVVKDMNAGDGLPPSAYEDILGKQAKLALTRGTSLQPTMVEGLLIY